MICIQCINPKCTAPHGGFLWDGRAHADGGPAQPEDPGSMAFLEDCPFRIAETYQTSLQSPDVARDMMQKMVAYKHSQLQRSQRALLVGFILMAVNIVVYLGCMPAVKS